MGAFGGGCCCCSRRAYSFPDQVQVQGSAYFHVWSLNVWWQRQSFPGGLSALASFFLGWGLGLGSWVLGAPALRS